MDGTSVENQLHELESVGAKQGWDIVERCMNNRIHATNDYPSGFDRLCRSIEGQKCDMVAAWSVDCLGHSLEELVIFLNGLHSERIGLYLHKQSLNTTALAPGRKRFAQMFALFAEFERNMIIERVRVGMEKAKFWAGRE
jgi:DNA invertase Pin-like site-specific DNA recombinase